MEPVTTIMTIFKILKSKCFLVHLIANQLLSPRVAFKSRQMRKRHFMGSSHFWNKPINKPIIWIESKKNNWRKAFKRVEHRATKKRKRRR